MIKPLHWWTSALCGLVLTALSISAATAETRVALVVGNSLYKNASLTLKNPKNDAQDVATVLRTLGFEVIVAIDATKRDLDLAMTQFARSATNADSALFYYAGHAIQYQGRNYLLPIDAELEDEISLRYQTTSFEDVRAAVDRAGGVKIVILDACRNNPIVDDLKRKMMGASRSVDLSRGLARIDRAQGIIVAYATAADEVASDGPGRNSPFTTALIQRLQDPGLEVAKMFRRIAADVNEMTHGRQRPEIYVSLIDEYFINQKDRHVWDQIKESTDPKAFRDFVANFPSSPQVSDAQYRLETLEQLARVRQVEKERVEQEALRARREEAERDRIERETAQRRQTEESVRQEAAKQEAAKQGAAKQEAAKQEVAKQEAAKQEVAKQEAAGQEAAKQEAAKQEAAKQEAATLAMLDQDRFKRERADRELALAKRRQDEEQRAKTAEAGQEKHARLTVEPAPQVPGLSQEQNCKLEEEWLRRLRANPAADQIARLERGLSCAKLRPEIARLRDAVDVAKAPRAQPDPPRQQVESTQPKADPGPQNAVAAPPSSLSPNEVCKRDEETLARLRASPAVDEIMRFERDLGCSRLRPQVVRLRESVGAD
jgi:Caspase domain